MPLKGYAVVWYVAFGNLNNGANAGLSYVNGNNGLTNRNWNYLPRLSENLSSKKKYYDCSILSAEKIESKSRRLVGENAKAGYTQRKERNEEKMQTR